jgi:mono/diheme cytochrome c family protein
MNMMVKKIGIIQITGLLMAGVAWSADAGTDPGAKTYGAKCASCHGKDGAGNAAMVKVFKVEPAALDMTKKSTLDKSNADLAKVIKDGLNKMPAYKEKLTDADIASVVAYMRTLAKK